MLDGTKNEVQETVPEIKAHQLMIHQSKAMISEWGNDKQQVWGFLTYFAIHLGATKFLNNEFPSLDDFLKFMANWRRVIGIILDHDPGKGMIRSKDLNTKIGDISFYKGQLPEISAQIEKLRTEALARDNPNPALDTSYHNIPVRVALKDTFDENNLALTYYRTHVTEFRVGDIQWMLNHVSLTDLPYIMQKAEKVYKELKDNPSLDVSVKRSLLKQILFYLVDGMPLWGGTAAVAQMIFHSLEEALFKQYTYFGQMRSAHGFAQGMQYDIFAMLSPRFKDFEEYITQNILTPNVKVQEVSPEEVKAFFKVQEHKTKAQLLEQIEVLNINVVEYFQLSLDLIGLLKVPPNIPYSINVYTDPFTTGYCYKKLIDFKSKMYWSLELLKGLQDCLKQIPEQDHANIQALQCTLAMFAEKITKLQEDFKVYMDSDTLLKHDRETYLKFMNERNRPRLNVEEKKPEPASTYFEYIKPITNIFTWLLGSDKKNKPDKKSERKRSFDESSQDYPSYLSERLPSSLSDEVYIEDEEEKAEDKKKIKSGI